MKSYLIIPMGGVGKRFVDLGYKTYKAFLPAGDKLTIFEKIIQNFDSFNLEVIIIADFNSLGKKYNKYFKKKKFKLINITKHKKGPLFSIYRGLNEINSIIKDNENIFICYSDINWNWDRNNLLKIIKKNNFTIFTHKNFHPHLEVNSKSDFCLIKKNKIKNILEKSKFSKDYKKDHLAIGCYYLKNLKYLNNFFKGKNISFSMKKEFYLVTFIKFLLKNKIKISNYNIDKFVHLGVPSQYIDFNIWFNELCKKKPESKIFKNYKTIMLVGGKGKRISRFPKIKPFLIYNKMPIYKYIFNKFNTNNKNIITNSNFSNMFDKNNYKIHYVKKTNSMFDTVFESRNILQNSSNYFLTSCDCFGNFNFKNFNKFITKKNSDLTLFAFKYSYMQKNLIDAHTQIEIKNNKLSNILVKETYKNNNYGHAGFFWIKSGNVFKYLYRFKISKYYKSLKREVLIDDYFKYLINNKLISYSFYTLNNYVHIGSEIEYLEYIYWKNYFYK